MRRYNNTSPLPLAAAASAVAAVLLLLIPAAASAHAQVIAIAPADGAQLPESPAELIVTFSEPVQPLRVSLVDGSGNPIGLVLDPATVSTLRVPVPLLPDDTYIFYFRVASADGHPIARGTTFTVGDAVATAATPQGDSSSSNASAVMHLLRFGTTSLVLLAIGIFLYRRIFAAAATSLESVLHGAGAALVVVSVVAFLPAYSGAGLAIFSDWDYLLSLFSQPVVSGQVAFAVGFLLFLLGVNRNADVFAAAGLFALLAGKTMMGHSVTASYPPLPSALLALHILLVAFWLGALIHLNDAVKREQSMLASLLQQFSALALPAVLLLVSTGGILAWLIIDDWRRLLVTTYGQLLVLKLSVVVAACAIALVNKRSLTPRLAAGDDQAAKHLQRNIRSEIFLLLAAIAITGVLAVTSPAGEAKSNGPPEAETVLSGGGYELLVRYTPVPAGQIDVTLIKDGQLVDAMELEFLWRLPDDGSEALRRAAAKTDSGYRSALPPIAITAWDLEADILIDDFTSIRMQGRIELR